MDPQLALFHFKGLRKYKLSHQALLPLLDGQPLDPVGLKVSLPSQGPLPPEEVSLHCKPRVGTHIFYRRKDLKCLGISTTDFEVNCQQKSLISRLDPLPKAKALPVLPLPPPSPPPPNTPMDALFNSLNQNDLRHKRKRRSSRLAAPSHKIQKYRKAVQRREEKGGEEEIFLEE